MTWANDDLANATAVSGSSGSITPVSYDGTTNPATSQTGESIYGHGETLWWKWTAPSSGDFEFATVGSPEAGGDPNGLDTKMQVFSGPSTSPTFAALTFVGSNDDNAAGDTYRYNSRVIFTATAGTTYYVQVDQYSGGQAGTLHLSWAPHVTPPPAPTAGSWTSSGTYATHTVFPGDDATVAGTDLDTVTTVTVGGVPQAFTATSPTVLVVHIDSSAVNGPIVVSNITGSATAFGYATVLYPGPWVQPPDESAQDDADGLVSYGPGATTSSTQPDFAGSPPAGGAHLSIAVYASHPQPSPTWDWDALLPVIAFFPPGAGTMPRYDASPDVAATPHAVDYETEAVPSTPTSDLTLTFLIDAETSEYLESTDNRTLAEDLWQETIDVRRIPAGDWDSSGFTSGVWPSQSALAALPVDHTEPLAHPGETLNLASVNGWTNNDASLDVFTTPRDYDDPLVVTWATLGSGLAWVVTFSSFIGASSLAVPYMDPSETLSVGNGTQNKIFFATPRIHAVWTYRPPRYRLLYDTLPVATAPRTLRRRQQAAPVGAAPRRRQISSVAGSLRRGPGAAP